MKGTLKTILTSAGALTIIAAVATAALAGTNALTADKIAQNNEATATAARRTVIDADEFAAHTLQADGGEITYYAAQKDGETVGYVFSVTSSGKSSGLVVMTGVDTNGAVTGVAITEDSETAGYVDKVTDGGLLTALVGQTDTDKVDAVSQATKTSKGVLKGVQKALDYYDQITNHMDT